MVALASVAELRSFVQNPEIPEAPAALVLDGISTMVRGFCRRAFAATEDEVVRLNGTGSYSLLLPRLPVVGVSTVLEAAGSSSELELVEGTNFEWADDGRLRRIDGSVWINRLRYYSVTYSHGEAVPDDVKLVVLRIAARGILNPEGLTQENAAGYGSTFGFDASRLAVLSPPDERALAPYRVTV